MLFFLLFRRPLPGVTPWVRSPASRFFRPELRSHFLYQNTGGTHFPYLVLSAFGTVLTKFHPFYPRSIDKHPPNTKGSKKKRSNGFENYFVMCCPPHPESDLDVVAGVFFSPTQPLPSSNRRCRLNAKLIKWFGSAHVIGRSVLDTGPGPLFLDARIFLRCNIAP